ncbi:16S rRNA (cytosine(1402)-N(4))-methyltransferase RsmH [Cryomorphaceae bacterium]|nr:16S rRNA (cytosine(1402)-N(4))-methyltransferase RsmH [Cryomorphaceae bacterium]
MSDYHVPALLKESLRGLKIKPEGTYVDCTFGGGGHSKAILDQLTTGTLYAFDKDEDAKRNVPEHDRLVFVPQDFRYMKNFLRMHGVKLVDGILADLGVSFHQFDTPDRGFSLREDGPLDMRMSEQAQTTAAQILNEYEEEQLCHIFRRYGEVRPAMRLARMIISAREGQAFDRVNQLKETIAPLAPKLKEHKFYAQVFQALRIEVNDELGALEQMLLQSVEILKTGGRLAVISYHSLEDRMVKNFMREGKLDGEAERDFFGNRLVPFKVMNRKPLVPTEEEVERNNRARSAKLRVAERI